MTLGIFGFALLAAFGFGIAWVGNPLALVGSAGIAQTAIVCLLLAAPLMLAIACMFGVLQILKRKAP
jgi:hypothetical protein